MTTTTTDLKTLASAFGPPFEEHHLSKILEHHDGDGRKAAAFILSKGDHISPDEMVHELQQLKTFHTLTAAFGPALKPEQRTEVLKHFDGDGRQAATFVLSKRVSDIDADAMIQELRRDNQTEEEKLSMMPAAGTPATGHSHQQMAPGINQSETKMAPARPEFVASNKISVGDICHEPSSNKINVGEPYKPPPSMTSMLLPKPGTAQAVAGTGPTKNSRSSAPAASLSKPGTAQAVAGAPPTKNSGSSPLGMAPGVPNQQPGAHLVAGAAPVPPKPILEDSPLEMARATAEEEDEENSRKVALTKEQLTAVKEDEEQPVTMTAVVNTLSVTMDPAPEHKPGATPSDTTRDSSTTIKIGEDDEKRNSTYSVNNPVVAQLVEETIPEEVVKADAVIEESTFTSLMHDRRCWLLILLVVAVIGGAVGGVLAASGGQDKDEAAQQKMSDELLDLLKLNSPDEGTNLYDPGSVQFEAFSWLFNDPMLETYSESRKIARYALGCFYHATGGEEWKNNGGWLDYEVSECDWKGVSCTNIVEGDVNKIELDSNNLTGLFINEISMLPELVQVNLYDNNLTGAIPQEIGLLKKLEWLFVDGNDIIGSMPPSICNLQSPDFGSLTRLEADCPNEIGCVCCTRCCTDDKGCVDM